MRWQTMKRLCCSSLLEMLYIFYTRLTMQFELGRASSNPVQPPWCPNGSASTRSGRHGTTNLILTLREGEASHALLVRRLEYCHAGGQKVSAFLPQAS